MSVDEHGQGRGSRPRDCERYERARSIMYVLSQEFPGASLKTVMNCDLRSGFESW